MRIFYTLVLISAVILHSIECSSQSARNSHSECYPGPSSSSAGNQHFPDRLTTEQALVRDRSRSPEKWSPSHEVLGHSLSELGYVRLIPSMDEKIQFEFRRCFFPEGIPIRMREDQNRRVPVSTREQIVLSLSNDDVFAILDYAGILRGIYATDTGYPRVKVNIISGAIERMTPEEMRVCPLGRKFPIFPHTFVKADAKEDSLKSVWNVHGGLLRARPSFIPGRPPSDEVIGYTLEKLGYIRLIPRANPNRRFEFRRYVIPDNRMIQLLLKNFYMSVPNREHIVLSTLDGDVFAILEYTGILRGIYAKCRAHLRIKINMISGAVNNMTEDEMKECHVGKSYPIFPRWFEKEDSHENSLQHVYH